MVDIKNVHEEAGVVKYLVKGTNYTFMNSIRRMVMSHVPCLAVDTVQFYENDSVVFDEMLAHRMGLLPIKTDPKTYKKGDKVKLVLEKMGPCWVTSKDIKCTDPKIEILDKKIIITKLGKEQKIKVEMNAIMNTGKVHAKFQPAIVSYSEVPSINNDKAYSNSKEIIDDMPKGFIEAKAGKLFLVDPYNASMQQHHYDLLEKHKIKMDYSETDFILNVETTGQLTAKEVVEAALKELDTKVEDFEKEFKKL